MTAAHWELLRRQGAREVWVKLSYHPDGTEKAQYKGEEYVEMKGERQKVEEVENFDTESQALGWLNAGVG
ncbi:hypothetical protein GQE99_12385 [Maritimibacter sp. DP07]|uniref:Uncharacterized protein n=1 Tax=Maritimibacter harenae TaxID=2606218 RepID=A0A845M3L5_9RHOB|nr:hypothetical protein [Maritimibacter harenae]MZR13812.1 hypothetical protein [Maritimibacter harenae]